MQDQCVLLESYVSSCDYLNIPARPGQGYVPLSGVGGVWTNQGNNALSTTAVYVCLSICQSFMIIVKYLSNWRDYRWLMPISGTQTHVNRHRKGRRLINHPLRSINLLMMRQKWSIVLYTRYFSFFIVTYSEVRYILYYSRRGSYGMVTSSFLRVAILTLRQMNSAKATMPKARKWRAYIRISILHYDNFTLRYFQAQRQLFWKGCCRPLIH